MTLETIIVLMLVALGLFLIQGVGGWFQVQDYRKTVRRLNQLGNIGVGQTRSLFYNNLVIMACNNEGVVTGLEVLDGAFIFSRFHPVASVGDTLVLGKRLDELQAIFAAYDKKQRKRRKGYIQAAEALVQVLQRRERVSESC
jgi:glucitol operon activator protein